MKMKKWNFLLMITCMLGVSFLLSSKNAAAETLKGKCGPHAKWTYTTKKKVLKITGKGAINKRIKVYDVHPAKVSKIIISKGITTLGGCAPFSELNVKCTLNIPKGIKKIEGGAFWEDCRFYNICVSKQNKHYFSRNNVIYTKDRKTLVYYSSNKKNKTFKLPKTITTIKPLAFSNNYYIQKVILPKKFRKLGGGAFFLCIQLKNINITSNTKINKITDFDGSKVNIHRRPITSDREEDTYFYNLPNDKKHSREYHMGTFEGTSITSFTVPDTVTSLPCDTFAPGSLSDPDFKWPSSLEKLTLGKNFTGEINTGNKPYNPKSLQLYNLPIKQLNISQGNKKYCIKDDVLYSKDGKTLYQILQTNTQTTFTMPSSVTRIAVGAFYKQRHISSLKINGNLKSIDALAFLCCNLTSIQIDGNVDTIGCAAFANSSITDFVCSVSRIEENAFHAATKMATIKLGNNLSHVRDDAFSSCYALKSITLSGDNLSYIGSDVFYYCRSLESIVISGPVKTIGVRAFAYCPKLHSVTYPPYTNVGKYALAGSPLAIVTRTN